MCNQVDPGSEVIEIPMLPMRNIVIFPMMTTPFFVGRPQSIEALEEALTYNRQVFVVAQKDPSVEDPTPDDLYKIGAVGNILQIMRLPNDTIKALFEAKHRGRWTNVDLINSSYKARVEIVQSQETNDAEMLAFIKSVKDEFRNFIKKITRNIGSAEKILAGNYAPGQLADLIAPFLTLSLTKQQELLNTPSAKLRLEIIYSCMLEEEEHRKIEQKLRERVQGQIGKTQKDYYLNEQIKAIQREMGAEDSEEELGKYESKIETCGMSQEAMDVAKKELKKLKLLPQTSSEANIVRNYLDWLTLLPWSADTQDDLSVEHAEEVLNADHYALEEVKERIVEYIAVANMVGKLRGPIICLVGPPGVGKTSLARSIARAISRKFVRMSLGGIRDEAEIRGHRRTYLGALPGKIIQSMKKAKTNNPVLLLDEIDKMGRSHMGDPASALLEVLDNEQNKEFMDHYMEVEYDLSNVMFICTANTKQDIPLPLMDRLEIINLSGYSEIEKKNIADKYLIPRQMEENGLKDNHISFVDSGIYEIIRSYTREAGVRNLERKIAKVCRKSVSTILKEKVKDEIIINQKQVNSYLGVQKFNYGKIEGESEIGLINGLAWTSVGGETLTIEVDIMKGSGKIQLTGKLGDVMKESAQTALSYVRANANSLGIFSGVFATLDIHVHVPEGATPKDGPSAGIAITSALVSALTGIPIFKNIALTGEVTLRGKVLPIGGLKEKLLAAKRVNISKVIIPDENRKDLPEIAEEITDGLEIVFVKRVGEVFKQVMERVPQPVSDSELVGHIPEETQLTPTKNITIFPESNPILPHS
jgi:ATP-dependent Lon protease